MEHKYQGPFSDYSIQDIEQILDGQQKQLAALTDEKKRIDAYVDLITHNVEHFRKIHRSKMIEKNMTIAENW